MARAEILQPFIESWEGGFANVPGDKGGPTNKGVTIATFRSIFGKDKTVEDLKKITDEQWLKIFKTYYWDRWKADNIEDQSIANLLVDWCWGSGVYGIRIPQRVLKVQVDGIVGKKTLAAINNHPDKRTLFNILWKERENHFKRLGIGSQGKFLRGWLNRLNGIQYGKLKCNGNKIVTF